MAQAMINHKCGHTTTEQLYGSAAERTRRAAWLATQPCRECDRQAALAAAAKATADLPPLSGSDKQIAWATTIRAAQLARVKEARASLDVRAAKHPGPDAVELLALADKAIASLQNRTESRFWIDNREEAGISLLKEEMRRLSGAD